MLLRPTSLVPRIQHAHRFTSINTTPRPTLDIKLPDLSRPQDTDAPHIPFMPDFWDSSRARAADAIQHIPASEAPGMPKVNVVAGAETHHAGGPSYSSSHPPDSDGSHGTRETGSAKTGFWGDVATDIGLPQSFDASGSFNKARDALFSITQGTATNAPKSSESRPLDQDEARGVWVFLGILGGSWLAGGLFSDSKKKKHPSHM